MLKRLRIKFVCINMALLTAMLCVILGLVVHFAQAGMEADSLRMMQSAAALSRPNRPGGPPEDFRLPYFIVRINRAGQLSAVWGPGFTHMSQEELRTLVEHAIQEGTPSGVLSAWQLRYLWVDGPEKSLVCADISRERAALAQLAQICALGVLGGFAALLLLSFFLARWAVHPVELAWEEQRQFVSDASHELKTPLTVITTNAELLQEPDRGPEEQARFSQNILVMSRRMRQLVERLLELARADSGRDQFVPSPLDFSALAERSLLPFEPVFFERGLTLTSSIQPGLWVKGSPSHLQQVLDILLDNAQKYAAPGGSVTLILVRQSRHLLLSLSNPGEELTKEELKHIFHRFYRADPSRSQESGFGLGLSIAEGIVRTHRGRIWAESREGRITFHVELPLQRFKQETAAQSM